LYIYVWIGTNACRRRMNGFIDLRCPVVELEREPAANRSNLSL